MNGICMCGHEEKWLQVREFYSQSAEGLEIEFDFGNKTEFMAATYVLAGFAATLDEDGIAEFLEGMQTRSASVVIQPDSALALRNYPIPILHLAFGLSILLLFLFPPPP